MTQRDKGTKGVAYLCKRVRLLGVEEEQAILENEAEEPAIGQLEEAGAGHARLGVRHAQLEGLGAEAHRDDWSGTCGQAQAGTLLELTAEEYVRGVLGCHG